MGTSLRSSLNRAVPVTGATGGIGHAAVVALLNHGFTVWATACEAARATDLRAEFGHQVHGLVFDVTDDAAVLRAAAEVLASGPLFGMVNNAGAALPGPSEYVPIEQFQRQLDINVTGQLSVTQALLPALRAEHGRGGTLES
jgi:NAD(P)-dependent dehydrogenase (short-subunit alcohol dehydrogenase family)